MSVGDAVGIPTGRQERNEDLFLNLFPIIYPGIGGHYPAMNVIQQFEEEYQEFLKSIKPREKRKGKVSAYHAVPSTLKVSARLNNLV